MIGKAVLLLFLISFLAVGFFIALILANLNMFGNKTTIDENKNDNLNDLISTLRNNNSNQDINVIVIYNNSSK